MIARLHHITQHDEALSHVQQAEAACAAGVRWVQLRVKKRGYEEWKANALAVQGICRANGAIFIVNDNVKICAEIRADGVHLGKEDMDVDKARAALGPKAIIGGTANNYEDIEKLLRWKVDYIGLGPFRFTTTKEKLSPMLGLDGYREVAENLRVEGITTPIIAIGGIQTEDVPALMETGVYGVAVASAINRAKKPEKAAGQFIESLAPWNNPIDS